MHNRLVAMSEETLASATPQEREWWTARKNLCPVNLRVLDGIDLAELNVEKIQDGKKVGPQYVDP